ncbi:hypothetical protein CNYM01_13711 [Colletotrichum nymphaeae SA-01]|uniref:Uncharacterized protein n=1 Tax=Colletotrichum nymphaeae SA-01 TaxID=1460502 RepID=A0A135RXH1_9PEZI|nr:hypothetical protein CNYM01_13711 [Colletotrichum nymphaeae SA-01]
MLCSNKCNVRRRRRRTTTRLSVSRKLLWRRSALALNEHTCRIVICHPSFHLFIRFTFLLNPAHYNHPRCIRTPRFTLASCTETFTLNNHIGVAQV